MLSSAAERQSGRILYLRYLTLIHSHHVVNCCENECASPCRPNDVFIRKATQSHSYIRVSWLHFKCTLSWRTLDGIFIVEEREPLGAEVVVRVEPNKICAVSDAALDSRFYESLIE